MLAQHLLRNRTAIASINRTSEILNFGYFANLLKFGYFAMNNGSMYVIQT